MLQIRYVWERPIRITHWVNFFSIVVLSITGIYIGAPFASVHSSSQYVMGGMRAVHFFFGYLFGLSLIVRIIWGFMGNQHARWFPAFTPWLSIEGWKRLIGTFTFYIFLRRLPPPAVGHNPLAATAYSGVFVLFLVQIVTGFALYGQFDPSGIWGTMGSHLLLVVGAQWMRLIHHVVMWLLIGFAIQHVYSSYLMNAREKNGTVSSIFDGFKFIDPEEHH